MRADDQAQKDEEQRVAELATWEKIRRSGHWTAITAELMHQRQDLILKLDTADITEGALRKLVGELVQNEKLQCLPDAMCNRLAAPDSTLPSPDDPEDSVRGIALPDVT